MLTCIGVQNNGNEACYCDRHEHANTHREFLLKADSARTRKINYDAQFEPAGDQDSRPSNRVINVGAVKERPSMPKVLETNSFNFLMMLP